MDIRRGLYGPEYDIAQERKTANGTFDDAEEEALPPQREAEDGDGERKGAIE